MSQEIKQPVGLTQVVLAAFALFLIFVCLNSSKTREKIRRKLSEAKKTKHTPDSIIIIAIEIADFVVLFSQRYRRKYRLLDCTQKSFAGKLMSYLTNNRPCIFPRFSPRAIRKFFKDLSAVESIKLVLYTKLERQVCTRILKDLNIETCFEIQDRIYTQEKLKSASEVDHDTGRVIIISTNREDLDRSVTSYHNLILDLGKKETLLDESILDDLKDCLVQLAEGGRVDTLHEDMHELTNKKGLPIHDQL